MSYPSINDKNFNNKITNKYIKYKIPAKKKTFNEICFPKSYTLQLPQQFLGEFINPKTPYKGLLVFHRPGSGKTMSACVMCEHFKNNKKIIFVAPASLLSNFRDELRSPGIGDIYLTSTERKKLKLLHPSSGEYIEIITKSNDRIDKYYNIFSYNKFITLIKDGELSLRNTLLVIDEIQNMVSETGTYYNVLYDAIVSAPKDLRVVIMSGTPMFDSPKEFALTLNLLRIPFEYPTGKEFANLFLERHKKGNGTIIYNAKNLDTFKEMCKGYVSYFIGAPEYTFPETIVKYVQCPMSEYQYRCYLTIIREYEGAENKKLRDRYVKSFYEGDLHDLPSTFLLGARLISNIAFPNKKINEDGLKSFAGKALNVSNLENYSIKFFKIFKKISRVNGPVFIYSNFLAYGGLKSFEKVLKHNGYKNYEDFGEGKKRYAFITGDQTKHLKEEIKNVYNQKNNIDGSKLKVLLLSSAAKEGLSLKAVRQVHILEPYWNKNRLEQVIARARRLCSHAMLSEEERYINIYIYIATHPNEKETVDQYIYKLAERKQKLIGQFEKAIKECAIDCNLNKHANEKDIVCDA